MREFNIKIYQIKFPDMKVTNGASKALSHYIKSRLINGALLTFPYDESYFHSPYFSVTQVLSYSRYSSSGQGVSATLRIVIISISHQQTLFTVAAMLDLLLSCKLATHF